MIKSKLIQYNIPATDIRKQLSFTPESLGTQNLHVRLALT